MPGAAIGIDLRVGRVGQRAMHRLPVLRRGRAIHRRADQRVTKRHARADREQPVGLRCRLDPDPEPLGRPPHQHRVADRLRRRDQQQPLGIGREAREPAAGSCPRSAPTVPARPANRTRPPAPPASTPAAAPTTPAGCRASQRRAARAPAHPTAHATPSPTKRAHHHRADPRPPASAIPRALRSAHASPTAARPTPPTAAAPRTRAPAPRPDQATARHRPHTQAAAPRPPPRTGSAPPTRPGTDPARSPHAARTPPPAPPAEGQEAGPGDPASARTTAADAANASSISDSTPTARATRNPDADSIADCSSAVLPTPGSPLTTNTRLCPPRTASSSRSSTSRSTRRPCNTSAGPSVTMPHRPYRGPTLPSTPSTTRSPIGLPPLSWTRDRLLRHSSRMANPLGDWQRATEEAAHPREKQVPRNQPLGSGTRFVWYLLPSLPYNGLGPHRRITQEALLEMPVLLLGGGD